jgi:hypothetical protein
MFAILKNSKSFDITSVLKDFDGDVKESMSSALLYLGFIHSIVRGKHEAKAKEYHWTKYE